MLSLATIWRYPVKSLQGERLDSAVAGPYGVEGDRSFGLRDVETGLILTARRQPDLLFASATWSAGSVAITLPDGSTTDSDADLSNWLGRPVELTPAGSSGTYENPMDIENDADWVQWTGPETSFHDSGRDQISMVSRATMRAWDERRFRQNLILDGDGEDELVGATVGLGGAVLEVTKLVDRCVMVTRPQPGDIERDLDVLRTISRERNNCLGVATVVTTPGPIQVGDSLQIQ
jgi:uncharacterized protein YcbX